jgi:hypothetical protein
MARFLVEAPHTKEDCLQALDSVVALSHSLMERFDWGCNDDVHVGWAVLEAENPETAKMLLPTFIRGKATATQLTKFTPDEVKAFHEGH